MSTNNPYSRTFKTKKEEYEEKLKQRNENQDWIFGNTFGRPGAGAPLRDKNGNIISNLKSITNDNIYKYEAQDFSKGENNISVVNHKIYERNNGDITNVISDPYTPFRNYINQFNQNANQNINNQNLNQNSNSNININQNNVLNPNINLNNISPNQIQINSEQLNNLNNFNNLNNLNYQNYQNNQIIDNDEEQKRQIYLDQFRHNPYLTQIQTPYGIVTQYPMIHPVLPLYTQNQNQTLIPNNNNLLMDNNNQTKFKQRPYTSLSENIPTNNMMTNNSYDNINNNNININNKTNNTNNNISNSNNNYFEYITGGGGRTRKYVKKLPESTLFNDIDLEKIKLDKERKMDEWKKELLVQINEKKRREAEEKRQMKEKEKKDELNNEKYLKYKKKQKDEHKNLMLSKMNRRKQSEMDGSMGNLLDLSNDLDQNNRSMHSQNNNILLKDNDFSQNNIQIQDNVGGNNFNNNFNENNADNNFYPNNQNIYGSQEEQNFKSYIDRQYHLLNDTLNHDINNELKRINEEIDNNYTPFTKKFLLMNTNSKTTAELSIENEKKLKKIQDLIEERKLVDYILGQRERPPTPNKDNINEQNIELPVPSFFGINRDKPENKYLGLHSKSTFINKNENVANYIASETKQIKDINGNMIDSGNLEEKQKINEKYRQVMNDEIDINQNTNQKLNTNKTTFGTNVQNDEALVGSINFAKNLDNVSNFIPLNKNRENINASNEQKIKFVPGFNGYSKIRDKDMDDLFKDLDKIYELTNKIDVTSKARNIAEKYDNDLNRLNKLNKELSNISINNSNSNYTQKDYNKNIINENEEKSNNSNNNISNNKISENNVSSYNNQFSENNSSNNNNINKDNDNKLFTNRQQNEKEENELSNSKENNPVEPIDNNDNINNDNINNDNINNNEQQGINEQQNSPDNNNNQNENDEEYEEIEEEVEEEPEPEQQ